MSTFVYKYLRYQINERAGGKPIGQSLQMKKLYKYRPLSDFLFKELYYQELYFASYEELNDPLDLSARIEFTPEKEEHVGYILWFIFKTSMFLLISDTRLAQATLQNKKLLLAQGCWVHKVC